MRTIHFFRASLYAAVCLATLGLWMGEDSPAPYPALVVLCVVAAYAFTDHWEMLIIPGKVAPVLGAAALFFFIREELQNYKTDLVLPMGHLFVFLEVILLFHRKKPRYYWWLLDMSFLQMVIAALHSNKLTFGIIMGVYLAVALGALTQFVLVRESERFGNGTAGCSRKPALSRMLVGSLGSCAVVLVAALLFFLVIPRKGETAWTQSQFQAGHYLSGFDEQIRLGQLGTILESDDEVMNVRLFDENGQALRPREDLLWRGVALTGYENGRWVRSVGLEPVSANLLMGRDRPEHYIRQDIRLQAIHRDVLFGLRPLFRAYTRTGDALGMIQLDGTLVRPEGVPTGPLQYTIESELDSGRPQLGEYSASKMNADAYFHDALTKVPASLQDALQEYVARLNLPNDQDPALLCRYLLAHLQDPNQFHYTLQATVNDSSIDPVLDFLLNRREGHCEYFASALALLLRAQGVPARVINGFKGGDWNEMLGKFIVVRQKHAHSWVEAIVATSNREQPRWVTLDPTPGSERQRMVAQVNRTPTVLRQVRDVSRQLWSNYVLNFNSSEQEAAIYEPARRMISQQAQNLFATAKRLWSGSPRGFNWLAALIVSGSMVVLFLLVWLASRLARSWGFVWAETNTAGPRGQFARAAGFLRSLLARWLQTSEPPRTRIQFYDQLLRTLELHGLHKRPSTTPQQFAEQAAVVLEGTPHAAGVARIPASVIDRFYRIRFGNENLSVPEAEEVTHMLQTLTTTLAKKE